MRKLCALFPIIAVVIGANALVASAGLPEAPAPSTIGYTVLVNLPSGLADEGDTTGETVAPDESTTQPTAAPMQVPDIGGDGVGALQGECEAQLATIDLTTGVVTPLPAGPSPEACAGDLTFGPDGTLYGLLRGEEPDDSISELVRFDTASGAATVIGQIGDFSSFAGFSELPIGGLAFDAEGRLFAALGTSNEFPNPDPQCLGDDEIAFCLYRIDDPNAPGNATFIGQSASGTEEDEIFFAVSTLNGSCTTMYSSSIDLGEETSTDTVTTVDLTSGALSDLGQTRPQRFVAGQATDRAGTLWALELTAGTGPAVGFELATLDAAGGTPIDTHVIDVTLPDEELTFLNALAIEPLDCAQPEPVVLAPTFTG